MTLETQAIVSASAFSLLVQCFDTRLMVLNNIILNPTNTSCTKQNKNTINTKSKTWDMEGIINVKGP